MKINEAKSLLRDAGYRLIKEYTSISDGIYGEIESVLAERGFTDNEIQSIMSDRSADIEEMIAAEKSAFQIADFLDTPTEEEDEITDEIDLTGDRWGDITDFDESYDDYDFEDEELLDEGKSRGKSDKFSHKEKVAYKNKKNGCCGRKNCRDCDDDDMDESTEDDLVDELLDEGKSRGKSDKFAHSQKAAFKKRKCSLDDEDEDDDDLDESYEDDMADVENRLIATKAARRMDNERKPVGEFNNTFRAKIQLLKKALSPKFVSELIKRNDFEIDEKDIKAYAIDIIENANLNAKDPVQALQKKIKLHFPGTSTNA